MRSKKPLISVADARKLLLSAQDLWKNPKRRASRPELLAMITRLGFVQVDSINVVARAHDLTLWSRMHDYRPAQLTHLLEKERSLFEHWTHDASILPTAFYAHWKPRFHRDRERILRQAWWQKLLGDRADKVIAHVLHRIEKEGPLCSADFEHDRPREAWWDWKPEKAALDYLWRTGELSVARRKSFQKFYDLSRRVYPAAHAQPMLDDEAHAEWICAAAAERLLLFTARELAAFFDAVEPAAAEAFCTRATKQGRLIPVEIEIADGSAPQSAWAVVDWQTRLKNLPDATKELRLLCPFDPVLRDRARCLRRFGFDYRFEAFTPPAQRRYGYYVLPILEGDQLIGRLDPKLHRQEKRLEVRALYWEPQVRKTVARKRALRSALQELASFLGATELSGEGV